MDAEVFPGHRLALATPQDEVLTQQSHRSDLAFLKLLAPGYGVPGVQKHGIGHWGGFDLTRVAPGFRHF